MPGMHPEVLARLWTVAVTIAHQAPCSTAQPAPEKPPNPCQLHPWPQTLLGTHPGTLRWLSSRLDAHPEVVACPPDRAKGVELPVHILPVPRHDVEALVRPA